jgi:hypothetical protein
MVSEQTAPDEDPAPDPLDAELVAYLDGELDEAAARRVEARLARDPAARARAAELKKSFDLLDYLPKPEPSPTFTTRTLEKLPAVRPGDSPPPDARAAAPAAQSRRPTSTSVPVPLDEDSPSGASRSRSRARPAYRRERWPLAWAGGLVAAVLAFAAVGYLASAGARAYLFPARDKEPDASGIAPEPRVVERLPLYAAADDIGFVAELAKPDYFGGDPAVAYDPTLKVPPTDVSGKPTAQQFDALAKTFRALTPARQAEVVRLDRELQAREPRERDRLFRVLEAYSAWLARLPDSERKGILAAADAQARLSAIRAARERQWIDALPPPRKARLGALTDPKSRAELVHRWRDEEEAGRDRWALVRRHAEAFAANKTPWPFDAERGRKDVIEFARHAFKTDEPRKCRLSPPELIEYNRTLAAARAEDSWAWYGLTVYELSKLHPYLPESDNDKLMITEPGQLPEPYHARLNPKKGFGGRPRPTSAGRWPDFPLEVLRVVPLFGKAANNPPALGPARLGDFKPTVREFAARELFPKMTRDERRELERAEGKWPDYPQKFLSLANKHNLPVPGVTLPGPPRKWEATYDLWQGAKP